MPNLPDRELSRKGGLARAAALTPARRSEIARMGWRAMVARRFGGDHAAAVAWLVARGLAAQDPCPWNGAFPDPGPIPGAVEDPDGYDPDIDDPFDRPDWDRGGGPGHPAEVPDWEWDRRAEESAAQDLYERGLLC